MEKVLKPRRNKVKILRPSLQRRKVLQRGAAMGKLLLQKGEIVRVEVKPDQQLNLPRVGRPNPLTNLKGTKAPNSSQKVGKAHLQRVKHKPRVQRAKLQLKRLRKKRKKKRIKMKQERRMIPKKMTVETVKILKMMMMLKKVTKQNHQGEKQNHRKMALVKRDDDERRKRNQPRLKVKVTVTSQGQGRGQGHRRHRHSSHSLGVHQVQVQSSSSFLHILHQFININTYLDLHLHILALNIDHYAFSLRRQTLMSLSFDLFAMFFFFFFGIFGSFGLSTKEPYTIMLCPSSLALVLSVLVSLASSSVHTSPCHRIRLRNYIFGIHTHICPPYKHIKYLVIMTCIFKWQPFWYFCLICCPTHIDSHWDFIFHIAYISSLPSYTKGIMPLSPFFLKFMSIFLKSIYSCHLNFICFDIWATKTKMCS